MSEQTSEANLTTTIKVLIVEDHELTRIGLKAALKRTSDIVVIGEAENGEEAITYAEQLAPDVILMDVGMPVMDGIQATQQILKKMPDRKIIMLTQHDNDRDILASLAAGAAGYCLKDVEPERLYTAIRSINAGDCWLDAAIAKRILKHHTLQKELSVAKEPSVTTANKTLISDNLETLDSPLVEPLSPRELEVLKLIVDGLSNQEIANKLIISLPTAKTHVRNILNKLAVSDRTQAAVHAMRHGLV